jgi:FKBP-type peptidyl-prolyl cis-trans isomerase (trigger factor)
MQAKFIGLAKGDVVEGNFVFPESYIDSTLRDKTIHGTLSVDLIKTRQNPELNIDFMKNVYPDIKDVIIDYVNGEKKYPVYNESLWLD